MVCWNSVNKIRLSLTKASFIYTKAEEGSGRKNYVIFITKIDHTIVEPIWRTSFDIYICKTKLICKTKFTCKAKLYFDYLSNLRVFVLQRPPKDVVFFSKKRQTIFFWRSRNFNPLFGVYRLSSYLSHCRCSSEFIVSLFKDTNKVCL